MSDILGDYLAEVGRYPLLTPDEEIELGRRIQVGIALQKKDNLTKRELRQIAIGKRAEVKFINSNLRLVVSVAKRYVNKVSHFTMLDLIQEGNIGLHKAVERFDPTRGYRFSTYSYWWIRQNISRAIMNGDNIIRMPHQVADLSRKIHAKGKMELMQQGRAVTAENLADMYDVNVKDVEMILQRSSAMLSLDNKTGGDSYEKDSSFHEFIADPSSTETEPDFYFDELEHVRTLILGLSDTEREIIELFWGLNDAKPMSYVEISKLLGKGRERIRQIEVKARRKLLKGLASMRSTPLSSRPSLENIPRVLPQRNKVTFLSVRDQKRQNLQFRNSEHRFL